MYGIDFINYNNDTIVATMDRFKEEKNKEKDEVILRQRVST